MRIIESIEELERFMGGCRKIHLYGAGVQANNFLRNLEICKIKANIVNILVTDKKENAESLSGIPIVQCDKSVLGEEDSVLLTVSDRIKETIVNDWGCCRAELVDPMPAFYYDVYNSIRPFVDKFPDSLMKLNCPMEPGSSRIVWTCWWQGEAAAPDIVKACWNSQRKNLADGTQHIIVTKDNYSDYITIPDFVMEKFCGGKNKIAHLADFIRCCLLYKYGGVWLDATVLLLDELPEACWTLPLYTWNFDSSHFCSKAIWTTWFLGAERGNVLYQFVMEAFLYYFSQNEKLKYYLTIDYFISICSNVVDGVLEQFKQIPYNNRTANNLCGHLREPYSASKFKEYCKESFLQKLSWHVDGCSEDSIFNYVISTYK